MGKAKIIPQKYIDKIIESNPYAVLISTHYVNQGTMMDIYCKKHGVKYQKTLKNSLRHNGCPECTREKMSKINS